MDFERLVIETTGLANPGPIIQTFLCIQLFNLHTKLMAL